MLETMLPGPVVWLPGPVVWLPGPVELLPGPVEWLLVPAAKLLGPMFEPWGETGLKEVLLGPPTVLDGVASSLLESSWEET